MHVEAQIKAKIMKPRGSAFRSYRLSCTPYLYYEVGVAQNKAHVLFDFKYVRNNKQIS